MKKLNQLVDCSYDIDILGVSDDSRNIKDGYLFVATKGYFVDHSDFIDGAILNGAVAVVAEKEFSADVPVIVVENVNDEFIEICQKYYDVSPCEFDLIGITGTDGKTTTSTIIQQLLNDISKTALIGTNGIFFDDDYYGTSNTTPCVSELYSGLEKIKEGECKVISMEVSSESLLHNRLKNFKYDIVGYTNITEDHLNIHKTIDNYINCKLSLLNHLKDDGIVVYNGDDKNCKSIKCKNAYSYGIGTDNDYIISDVKEMSNFVNFVVVDKDKKYKISSPLKGLYNVYNVTLAFVICLLKGIDSAYLIEKIKNIETVRGRRENLNFGQDFTIILDYAHTFNGIKNILDSVKDYKRVITVTGAAGGREKEKRAKIGSMVIEKSDVTIFTMDDPRYESVDEIIDQMAGDASNYLRICDRKEAIFKAFSIASCDPDAVVLILGKGRDNYMAIEDKRIPYCDYDVIAEYFAEK